MLNDGSRALLVLIVVAIVVSALSQNTSISEPYCNPELCRMWNGTDYVTANHIACGNNNSASEVCGKDAHVVNMDHRQIDLILKLHNSARNMLALGKLPGYSAAAAMPIIKWNSELAYLAGLNVRTCQFKHDACRNTNRFNISGQNIGFIWQLKPIRSISRQIKFVVGKWFFEYPDANQTFIDSLTFHAEGKQIGHFTLMVSDRVQRVGCAAIRYVVERGYKFLMTCNYDFTNIAMQRVYETGDPATKCAEVPSKRYPGLCEWDDDHEDSEETNDIELNLLELHPHRERQLN